MGPTLNVDGAFKGQEVPVTPLIGKLRIHMQGYVDQEEFFISPLLHQDVILGVPWFHRKSARLIFPERLVTFSHKGKDMIIRTQNKGNSIPLVDHKAYNKSMKSVLSSYMIFVRDLNSESAEVNKSLTSQEQEYKSFLKDYADCSQKPCRKSCLLQEEKMTMK